MAREFLNDLSDLLFSQWGALFLALLGVIGWYFRWWVKNRKPALSNDAKWVLERIRADTTHEGKGITIHTSHQMPNMAHYWFFRMQDGDEKLFNDTHPKAVGMFYPLEGDTLKVISGTEELLANGYLIEEGEGTVRGTVVYRLKKT